jgi:hypothetical protein
MGLEPWVLQREPWELPVREKFDPAKHPRDPDGKFGDGIGVSAGWVSKPGARVPRTPEQIGQARLAAYEKRWGPADADARRKILGSNNQEQYDDPELLDAFDAALDDNREQFGEELFDYFGELPIQLRENLGEGMMAAVARADGTYAASALRDDRFGPSIMAGKGPPRPPRYGEPYEHPATGNMIEPIEDWGVASSADLATVVRHEWWHYVEGRLSREEQSEYRSLFPRTSDGRLDKDRIARELTPNAAENWQEAAAETFAVGTHPKFKAHEWPEWVADAKNVMTEMLYQKAGL